MIIIMITLRPLFPLHLCHHHHPFRRISVTTLSASSLWPPFQPHVCDRPLRRISVITLSASSLWPPTLPHVCDHPLRRISVTTHSAASLSPPTPPHLCYHPLHRISVTTHSTASLSLAPLLAATSSSCFLCCSWDIALQPQLSYGLYRLGSLRGS